jgi:hypothetical protein
MKTALVMSLVPKILEHQQDSNDCSMEERMAVLMDSTNAM